MKPYTKQTNRGRTIAMDDIHHRTADQPRDAAVKAAKAARHGARQEAASDIATCLQSFSATGADSTSESVEPHFFQVIVAYDRPEEHSDGDGCAGTYDVVINPACGLSKERMAELALELFHASVESDGADLDIFVVDAQGEEVCIGESTAVDPISGYASFATFEGKSASFSESETSTVERPRV